MIDHDDPLVQVAIRFVGAWYRWGGGHALKLQLDDVAGISYHGEKGRGFDCSGSCIAFSEVAGLIQPGTINTNADGLAWDYLDAVDDPRPGDFCLYDRNADGTIEHITIYLGDGMEVTMSGGGRATKGDNPAARGQIRPVNTGGLVCYATWKAAYRLRT